MAALDVVESARIEVQEELDSAKLHSDRNRLGQFATPAPLAEGILLCAQSQLPQDQSVRFLDPAFGTGSFYSALLRLFPPHRISKASGYEIDPHYGYQARNLWSHTPLQLSIADFTKAAPPTTDNEKSNLIICNPPYVRHHHISPHEKVRLRQLVQRVAEVRLSGLSGLYCYFMLISNAWLADNGLAGWLIPCEFMDVNYGLTVKDYLLRRTTLLRIHRFDADDVQFDDALVSSAVVWLRNADPPRNHVVEFTSGGTLEKPRLSKLVPADLLRTAAKWSSFFRACDGTQTDQSSHARLSDLFQVKRGIATGANEFFILSSTQVLEHNLPDEFLVPILPPPRYLPVDEVRGDPSGSPELDHGLFLLACDLPEPEVRAKYRSLWSYLQMGVRKGISERYLCRHRSPWYAQERRPAAILLCTYMGRKDSETGRLFRFILNHSNATATNGYLMLYPKPVLNEMLLGKTALIRDIWQALNILPSEVFLTEGRVYGGGLHKMEPRELAGVSAASILKLIPGTLDICPRQVGLF